METIDVFYQREGSREIDHLEVSADTTFEMLRVLLSEKHGVGTDTVLFLEDSDEPANDSQALGEHGRRAGAKVHLHRCRHVEVSVTFNNKAVEHRFAPGTTVAKVKKWSAETQFGMTREEASEHVLQIAGTHDRPPPGTHLGALATCPRCRVSFDLVPDHRVNGWS